MGYESEMTRRRLQSNLEPQLLAIAQRMTTEVAEVVRRHLAAEIARVMAGRAKGAARVQRGRRRRGALNTVLLDELLTAIRKSPGLRSEQIYKKLPEHSRKLLKAGLAKLRAQKKVKTTGQKRSTTYRLA